MPEKLPAPGKAPENRERPDMPPELEKLLNGKFKNFTEEDKEEIKELAKPTAKVFPCPPGTKADSPLKKQHDEAKEAAEDLHGTIKELLKPEHINNIDDQWLIELPQLVATWRKKKQQYEKSRKEGYTSANEGLKRHVAAKDLRILGLLIEGRHPNPPPLSLQKDKATQDEHAALLLQFGKTWEAANLELNEPDKINPRAANSFASLFRNYATSFNIYDAKMKEATYKDMNDGILAAYGKAEKPEVSAKDLGDILENIREVPTPAPTGKEFEESVRDYLSALRGKLLLLQAKIVSDEHNIMLRLRTKQAIETEEYQDFVADMVVFMRMKDEYEGAVGGVQPSDTLFEKTTHLVAFAIILEKSQKIYHKLCPPDKPTKPILSLKEEEQLKLAHERVRQQMIKAGLGTSQLPDYNKMYAKLESSAARDFLNGIRMNAIDMALLGFILYFSDNKIKAGAEFMAVFGILAGVNTIAGLTNRAMMRFALSSKGTIWLKMLRSPIPPVLKFAVVIGALIGAEKGIHWVGEKIDGMIPEGDTKMFANMVLHNMFGGPIFDGIGEVWGGQFGYNVGREKDQIDFLGMKNGILTGRWHTAKDWDTHVKTAQSWSPPEFEELWELEKIDLPDGILSPELMQYKENKWAQRQASKLYSAVLFAKRDERGLYKKLAKAFPDLANSAVGENSTGLPSLIEFVVDTEPTMKEVVGVDDLLKRLLQGNLSSVNGNILESNAQREMLMPDRQRMYELDKRIADLHTIERRKITREVKDSEKGSGRNSTRTVETEMEVRIVTEEQKQLQQAWAAYKSNVAQIAQLVTIYRTLNIYDCQVWLGGRENIQWSDDPDVMEHRFKIPEFAQDGMYAQIAYKAQRAALLRNKERLDTSGEANDTLIYAGRSIFYNMNKMPYGGTLQWGPQPQTIGEGNRTGFDAIAPIASASVLGPGKDQQMTKEMMKSSIVYDEEGTPYYNANQMTMNYTLSGRVQGTSKNRAERNLSTNAAMMMRLAPQQGVFSRNDAYGEELFNHIDAHKRPLVLTSIHQYDKQGEANAEQIKKWMLDLAKLDYKKDKDDTFIDPNTVETVILEEHSYQEQKRTIIEEMRYADRAEKRMERNHVLQATYILKDGTIKTRSALVFLNPEKIYANLPFNKWSDEDQNRWLYYYPTAAVSSESSGELDKLRKKYGAEWKDDWNKATMVRGEQMSQHRNTLQEQFSHRDFFRGVEMQWQEKRTNDTIERSKQTAGYPFERQPSPEKDPSPMIMHVSGDPELLRNKKKEVDALCAALVDTSELRDKALRWQSQPESVYIEVLADEDGNPIALATYVHSEIRRWDERWNDAWKNQMDQNVSWPMMRRAAVWQKDKPALGRLQILQQQSTDLASMKLPTYSTLFESTIAEQRKQHRAMIPKEFDMAANAQRPVFSTVNEKKPNTLMTRIQVATPHPTHNATQNATLIAVYAKSIRLPLTKIPAFIEEKGERKRIERNISFPAQEDVHTLIFAYDQAGRADDVYHFHNLATFMQREDVKQQEKDQVMRALAVPQADAKKTLQRLCSFFPYEVPEGAVSSSAFVDALLPLYEKATDKQLFLEQFLRNAVYQRGLAIADIQKLIPEAPRSVYGTNVNVLPVMLDGVPRVMQLPAGSIEIPSLQRNGTFGFRFIGSEQEKQNKTYLQFTISNPQNPKEVIPMPNAPVLHFFKSRTQAAIYRSDELTPMAANREFLLVTRNEKKEIARLTTLIDSRPSHTAVVKINGKLAWRFGEASERTQQTQLGIR